MAKTVKKTVRKAAKAKKASVSRSRRFAGQLASVAPSPWGSKEQALNWAIQASYGQPQDATTLVRNAKVFEEYLNGGARGK